MIIVPALWGQLFLTGGIVVSSYVTHYTQYPVGILFVFYTCVR